MAKLILGPSGAGKSTFINTSLLKTENLIFGHELEDKKFEFLKFWKKNKKITKESIVHYNILNSLTKSNNNQDVKKVLENDKILKKILNYNSLFEEVIVIVAPIKELISRAISRENVENNMKDKYDNEFWFNLIKKTNFYDLYNELFIILDNYKINYKILYSSLNNFKLTQKSNIKKNLDGIYE